MQDVKAGAASASSEQPEIATDSTQSKLGAHSFSFRSQAANEI